MCADVFSDHATNLIENLAERLAEQNGGRLTPNHLLPYLPLSLDLIKTALDGMVDGVAVVSEKSEGGWQYLFTNHQEAPARPGTLSPEACLSCSGEMSRVYNQVICPACFTRLKEELDRLADATGWPVRALVDHEILYLASRQDNPVHPATLAGRSRFTLKQLKKGLERLVLDGYIDQDLDEGAGAMVYHFPKMIYPTDFFRTNLEIIESYPASVAEEVETKVTHILFGLGLLVVGLLGLAFLRIPFPVLILLFLVAAPVIAISIWRKRKKIEFD